MITATVYTERVGSYLVAFCQDCHQGNRVLAPEAEPDGSKEYGCIHLHGVSNMNQIIFKRIPAKLDAKAAGNGIL